MPTFSKSYIYGLCHPETAVVHYVGKAKNPHSRFKDHLRPASLAHNTLKNNWIKSLLKQGLRPYLCALGWGYGDAVDEERYWIKRVRELWPGTNKNSTDGGEGTSGHIHSLETKEKMRQSALLIKHIPPEDTMVDRFFAKVDIKDDEECWPWLGATNDLGYGQLRMGQSKVLQAGRVAYYLLVGLIPRKAKVLQDK